MRVLVIGATGNVGSRVACKLHEQGIPVRAFVRNETTARQTLSDDIDVTIGDLSDPRSIQKALGGVDRVLLSCSNQPEQAELEINAIDAAAAAGMQKIVKLSSIRADVDAPLSFWQWHGVSEQHLRESGVPWTILQSNFYMSNILMAAEQVRDMDTIFAPAEGAKIAMIDPADVAAAAVVVLTARGHEKKIYELSGPEAITYEQVATELSASLGRPIQFVAVPGEAARQGLLETGMPLWFANGLVALFELLRKGEAENTTDCVEDLTGRKPRSFAQFAQDQAGVFRAGGVRRTLETRT